MSSLDRVFIRGESDVEEPSSVVNVDGWFLMGSVYPVAAILVVYLYFVLRLGPSWMQSRKPFNLQTVILLYNAFQVAFNAWMFLTFIQLGSASYLTTSWCEPFHRTNYNTLAARFPHLAWWYFFCKVIELLDTVFFVLRKKDNQVTFLHVYHHTSMVFFVWGYLKYHQGEQAMVVGMFNTFVHVVMYSYYILSALGPQYQKYLWWKKYMTWIQLVQFCLVVSYNVLLLTYDCPLSKPLSCFYIASAVLFFVLFSKFYISTYKNKAVKSNPEMKMKHANNNKLVCD